MNFASTILILSFLGFLQAPDLTNRIDLRQQEKKPFNPLVRLPYEKFQFSENFINETNDNRIKEEIDEFLSMCTYLCPVEDSRIDEIIYNDSIRSLNCLLELESEAYETKTCQTEVQPVIRETEQTCGPKIGEQEMYIYQFVYRQCTILDVEDKDEIKINSQDYMTPEGKNYKFAKESITIVYEFCFNTSTNEVMYTWHKIWLPVLLTKTQALGKLAVYESKTSSTEPYGIFENIFKVKAAEYEQEIKNDQDLGLHMMVPPKHLAFGLWKKTVYHYANLQLMKSIDIQLWNYIDEHIRQKAVEMNVDFKIYMGWYRIPRGEKSEIIWVKLIHHEERNDGAVILLYDKPPSEEVLPPPKPGQRKRLCPEKHNQKCFRENPPRENGDEFLKRVVCCSIQQEHIDVFNIQFLFHDYIAIDKLIEPIEDE